MFLYDGIPSHIILCDEHIIAQKNLMFCTQALYFCAAVIQSHKNMWDEILVAQNYRAYAFVAQNTEPSLGVLYDGQ